MSKYDWDFVTMAALSFLAALIIAGVIILAFFGRLIFA